MKSVVAIIQPSQLEEVENALRKAGISGITITEVMGFGHQEPTTIYRDIEPAVSFVPKTEVEVVVPDYLVGKIVEAVTKSARMGQIGDGKIFVTNINHAMRIRTGEIDDAAL